MIGRYTWRTGVLEALLIVAAFVSIAPIFALLNVAFKDPRNISSAFLLQGDYTWNNFATAWVDGRLGPALTNSLVITASSVLLILILAVLAAYPLARIFRPWSRFTFYGFMLGLVIPGQLALLPLYRTMNELGLTGSVPGVILLFVGGSLPFTVFLLTAFLRELPLEYEEAAALDGCGPVRTLTAVVVPMLRPAIGTAAILNALAVWNNFFLPLLYLSGSGQETAPVRINTFVGQYSTNWPVIFAALTVTSIPILALYFLLQRHIIKGFASGIKG
ncbi:MAG: carbohydrate ABC transporter permease [Microbacteriaceae bacterium]|nr:carbohydrate ABC transporter permease [Microbacteriaceae bacterium]